MKKKNAKEQKKSFKNLLKNNMISVVVLVLLISVVGVFAGNVFVTDGDVDVGNDLNVSDVLYVDSSNSGVGIGVSSPRSTLQVGSTATVSGPTSDTFTVFDAVDGEFIAAAFVNDIISSSGSTNEATSIILGWRDSATGIANSPKILSGKEAEYMAGASADAYMAFYTTLNNAITEQVRITSEGKVGIGTTNPDQLLTAYRDDSSNTISNLMIEQDGTGDATMNLRITGATDWAVGVDNSDGDKFKIDVGALDLSSPALTIDKSDNVGIGTTSPSYPLEVNGDASGISIYASKNISATGYITRTSVFDKSKGSALDFVRDAEYYLTSGEIDHKKFYGYAGEFEVTDYSRPETDLETGEVSYPYTKIEEGVSLDAEINVLRQAVYELKGRLDEVCKKDSSYSWC